MLGLLALASYQNFADVEKITMDEATKLAALYLDASAYPAPSGPGLATQLRMYTQFVINEAWPLQKRGVIPTKGTMMINEFQQSLIRFEPKTIGQEILHAETYRQLNPHIILSAVISFYLATLIALIAAMDNPFRGEVCVAPEPYEFVNSTVMSPEPRENPATQPAKP